MHALGSSLSPSCPFAFLAPCFSKRSADLMSVTTICQVAYYLYEVVQGNPLLARIELAHSSASKNNLFEPKWAHILNNKSYTSQAQDCLDCRAAPFVDWHHAHCVKHIHAQDYRLATIAICAPLAQWSEHCMSHRSWARATQGNLLGIRTVAMEGSQIPCPSLSSVLKRSKRPPIWRS
jgi:hypothetical protein